MKLKSSTISSNIIVVGILRIRDVSKAPLRRVSGDGAFEEVEDVRMSLRFYGFVEIDVVLENGAGRRSVSDASTGGGGVPVTARVVQIPVHQTRLLLYQLPLMRLHK